MKIDVNKIPFEGIVLSEEVNPSALDMETELIKFRGPVRIKADISRITNAVTAHLTVNVLMYANCCRCLNEFETDLKKNMELNYQVDKTTQTIDLNPDIRQELIVDYPIKPLCSIKCKGLCSKCGKNINDGECECTPND